MGWGAVPPDFTRTSRLPAPARRPAPGAAHLASVRIPERPLWRPQRPLWGPQRPLWGPQRPLVGLSQPRCVFLAGKKRSCEGSHLPNNKGWRMGVPPLKAKKSASAAGDAWAFDFARMSLLVSGFCSQAHPRTRNRGPRRSRGVPGPGEPSRSTFFSRSDVVFSENTFFAGKKRRRQATCRTTGAGRGVPPH